MVTCINVTNQIYFKITSRQSAKNKCFCSRKHFACVLGRKISLKLIKTTKKDEKELNRSPPLLHLKVYIFFVQIFYSPGPQTNTVLQGNAVCGCV